MNPAVALRAGFVLLIVMGLSGFLVGATLGWALLTSGFGMPTSGFAVVIGLLAYGAALTAAGVGLLLGRRWAWPLGVSWVALGLVLLLVILVTLGADPVIGGGVLIWGVTLALLIVGEPARVR